MILPTLGIDIAKEKFNVCLLKTGGKLKHKVFPNTEVGFQQLAAWLSKQGAQRLHACMEATGAYGEALALHLYTAEHTVSVVNPAAIKAFAGSCLSRTKTDRVDASVDRSLLSRAATTRVDAAGTRSPAVAGTCASPGVARRDAHDGIEPAGGDHHD